MSENLKELCRTCLCSGGEMFSLLTADARIVAAGFPTIATIMKMFTSAPFNSTDDFPDNICGICLNEMQRAYIFKQKCEKSEKILHQLKEFKIKVKKFKNISNRNENDCEFQRDIKEEPDEIISEYEDLISENIGIEKELKLKQISHNTQFHNIDHTSSEFLANFKREPELIIEDFSIRLIDCDNNKTKEAEEQLNCPACGRESQSLALYFDHIVSDHIKENLCNICNEEFNCSKFDHLAKHRPSNCTDALFDDLVIRYFDRKTHETGEEILDEKSVVYAGTVCEKNINTKCIGNELIDEELIDEEFVDEQNFERSQSSEGHMKTKQRSEMCGDEPKNQCKICSKTFTRRVNLNMHMKIHTGEKPFECELCLKKFRQRRLLRNHLETKHTNKLSDIKSKHQCKICSKVFAYNAELSWHLLTHTGEKPFKCKLCLGKFLNKRLLNEHLRTQHTKSSSSLKSKNQCSVCSAAFNRKSYLRVHMRIHSGETPYQCELCSQQFRYKELFRIHMVMKHTEKSPKDTPKYQCYVCSKIFGYSNHLTNHMRIHKSEKSFECQLCSVKFWYSSSLISHMKTKHTEELPGDEPKYNCSHCSHIFDSNEQLMQHMVEHTDKKLIESENVQHLIACATETEQPNESYSFKPIYQCGNCSKIFVNNGHLIIHMRSHSDEKPFQCELCLEKFNQNSFYCHMRTKHSEELTGAKPKFQCNICSKIFGYNKDLNRHMLSHTGERPLQCEICSEKFRYKQSLERHMSERHPNGLTLPEPKYECQICSRICRRQNDLKIHMRSHTIQKILFKCNLCSQKFKQEESLVCHMKLRHSTDRPNHKCSICSEIFVYIKDLNKHMRRHTSETCNKCKLCPKKYRSNESLVRHMRLKHPKELADAKLKYQCSHCSEAFIFNKDLVSHMRSHKGEAMLQCNFCSTKFVHKVSLLRHMRTHHPEETLEPERSYQCNLCSQTFRRQDNLLKHVRRHNKTFACDLCSLRFKYEGSLHAHKKGKHPEAFPDRDHTKYQCNVCSKNLFCKSHFDRHMRSHTGEKSFQCELCTEKFSYKDSFLRHMEVEHAQELNNAEEFPYPKLNYKCSVCSKNYIHYNSLVSHMENHKGVDPVPEELKFDILEVSV